MYKLNGLPVIYFAGWKQHYSIYPASDNVVAVFEKELAPYELTKGTIRFPLSEPVPVKLIAGIAKLRAKDVGNRGRSSARETQLGRVRRMCSAMPSASEKVSHGAPTFFVEKDKGVFAVFADNHHGDGHLAVWLPAPPGLQSALISDAPETYGVKPGRGERSALGGSRGPLPQKTRRIAGRPKIALSPCGLLYVLCAPALACRAKAGSCA